MEVEQWNMNPPFFVWRDQFFWGVLCPLLLLFWCIASLSKKFIIDVSNGWIFCHLHALPYEGSFSGGQRWKDEIIHNLNFCKSFLWKLLVDWVPTPVFVGVVEPVKAKETRWVFDCEMSSVQSPCWWGYIWDITTQLYIGFTIGNTWSWHDLRRMLPFIWVPWRIVTKVTTNLDTKYHFQHQVLMVKKIYIYIDIGPDCAAKIMDLLILIRKYWHI